MMNARGDSLLETQQFGQLRARIEATFNQTAMIVVTSSERGDGKSVTAYGLAASFADADYRVLFIDANVHSPVLPRVHHRPIGASRLELGHIARYCSPVVSQRFSGVSLADDSLEAELSFEKVKLAVADIQRQFDYTIVDTSPLTHSNLAVLFSKLADGTMLTLRSGRLATVTDDEAVKTLARIGANVLGALTVSPKTIKQFRARVAAQDAGALVQPRHVTTRHSIEPVAAREVDETVSRTTFVS